MAEVLGDRQAFLCREATKVHEEYVRGRLLELRERQAAGKTVRGEIVLVVTGAPEAAPAVDEEPEALFTRLAGEGRTRREAVKEVAGWITPVPGGVGQMTIACLLRNTLQAACRQAGPAPPD